MRMKRIREERRGKMKTLLQRKDEIGKDKKKECKEIWGDDVRKDSEEK